MGLWFKSGLSYVVSAELHHLSESVSLSGDENSLPWYFVIFEGDGDENILDLDSGNGYPVLWIDQKSLNYAFYALGFFLIIHFKRVNFMIWEFYFKETNKTKQNPTSKSCCKGEMR